MMERSDVGYPLLGRPEILMGLFHPRSEYGSFAGAANNIDVSIRMEGNILVAGRFHITEKPAPNKRKVQNPLDTRNPFFVYSGHQKTGFNPFNLMMEWSNS